MKILIVHRHYWPDTTPQATILRSIAKRWTEDNHEVVAFSGQPSYNDAITKSPWRETLDGSQVRRVPLLSESKSNYLARAANYALFLARAAAHVLRTRDYDLVVALTTPPLLPALLLRNAAQKTGAAFLYHCLDIYPEVALATQLMPEGRWSNLLRSVDAWSAQKSDAVVVLSTDMRDLQVSRGVDPSLVHIINNIDIEEFEATTEALPPTFTDAPDNAFQVVFAGNLGRFQCLPTIIECAQRLSDEPGIRFDFFGDGVSKASLIEKAGPLVGQSVFFHGRVAAGAARQAVEQADAAVISLDAGVIAAAYPSKTVTYLKAGATIIAMVEEESELARMVKDEGIGRVVPPGDAAAMAAAIQELRTASDVERQAMRGRSLLAFTKRFDRTKTLDAWSGLARSIDQRGAG